MIHISFIVLSIHHLMKSWDLNQIKDFKNTTQNLLISITKKIDGLLRFPVPSVLESIHTVLIILNSLINLLLTVHHKRTILHHGLAQRLASNQNEPQRFRRIVPRLQAVTRSQKNEVMGRQRRRSWIPKNTLALQNIHKRIPGWRYRLSNAGPGLEGEVEIHSWSCGAYWWLDTQCLPCNDSDFNTIFRCFRNILAAHFLIPGLNPVY